MKQFRRIIFYSFLVSTVTITAFAFWFFSGTPDEDLIAKAFPLDSYEVFSQSRKIKLFTLGNTSNNSPDTLFRNFSVINEQDIKERDYQQFLRKSLLRSLKDGKPECFEPNIGLRITDEKRILDIVISSKCSSVKTYYKDMINETSISSGATVIFANIFEKTRQL